MSVTVVKPCLLTTIQDEGRKGYEKVWNSCKWSYGYI